jgi:NAD(P)-dependent dehydrogenase (short-subunit alcohol dehydrogenase family)
MQQILITGAGRGIGYATALALSARPGTRVLALSRNGAGLQDLVAEGIRMNPHAKIVPLVFDLENGDWKELGGMLESYGELDVLVNNAATIVVKPFQELSEAEFERVYKVNVIRVAGLIRQVLPKMIRTGKGRSHVVNISSMGGFQGSAKFAGLSAYSSSKAALCGLSECLAEEFRALQVSVNCLCLGAVQTEMLAEAFPGYQAPLSAAEMGAYISEFACTGQHLYNGKVLPVSASTP